MRYIDITELLRSALVESGCNEEQMGSFDGNSTIEIECKNGNSIFINEDEGEVWVWARLNEENNYLLMQKSSALLELLMTSFPWSGNDQLQLVNDQGSLVLKCHVKPNYLASGLLFAEVLEQFMASQNAYMSVLH